MLFAQAAALLLGDSSDLIVGDAKGYYAWAWSAVAAAHLVAWVTPSVAADGVSWPYHVLVVLELVLLALAGLVVLHRALVTEGVSHDLASLLVVGMVTATNLLHYLAKEPAMAHAAGVAILCLIIGLIACPSAAPWSPPACMVCSQP